MRCFTQAYNHLRLYVVFVLHLRVAIAAIQPVKVDFGPDFLGYDGQWSPVQIRVGTNPEQWLLLLPNTLSSDTWVVGPGGCDGTQTCQSERGGLFYWNQSTSWDDLGYYYLGYDDDLSGTASIGQYGLDNVSISDTIAAGRQSVAIINSTSLWLGEFGLSVKETRFIDNTEHVSFLAALVQNLSLIPSHSYGYTAGAPYALKGVAGSLTLGGVDTTRFTTTSASFSLSNDYEPIVAITGISVASASGETIIPSNWNASPLSLMTAADAYMATIDTSTPFLWMPAYVCDIFASALNLTYDENLDLYVFASNGSSRSLADWDLTFTFTLANSPNSTATFNVPISYNAFDLQITYPFPGFNATSLSPAIDYFPLRKANSTSQYIIGRAFLQEAYLTVDYERSVFSVSRAVFPDLNKVSPILVPITRPLGSTWPGPQTEDSSSLSTGAKAGIGVSVAFVVLCIVGLALYWRRKRITRQSLNEKAEVGNKRGLMGIFSRRKETRKIIPELIGDKQQPKELHTDTSNSRFELHGEHPSEMPAEEVSSAYYEVKHGAILRNDLRRPAELGHCDSTSKAMMTTTIASANRDISPVPPYSPSGNSHTSHRVGDSISPNDTQDSAVFSGSGSSGEHGVSPVEAVLNAGRRFTGMSNQALSSPMSLLSSADTTSATQNSTRISHLVPPQAGTPTRTASRSSRFREELANDTPRFSVQDDVRAARARYSWED